MSKRPYSTRLNKLGLDARTYLSKQEEIGILDTLHDAFQGTGNYLEALFSKALANWASEEIRKDFLPSVMSAWSLDQIRINVLENELDARSDDKNQVGHLTSLNLIQQERIRNLERDADELRVHLADTRIRAERAEEVLAQLKLVLDLINGL